MKKFILLLFFLSGCGDETSSRLVSGLPLTDSINKDPAVTLNYRINQSAINAHSSFAFLNQLEKWNEANIPESWNVPDLNTERELFRYLHKKANVNEISSVTVTASENLEQLVFHSIQQDYVLWMNNNVTEVRWIENNQTVRMQEISANTWSIEKGTDHFTWKVDQEKICDSLECLSL